MKKELSWVEIQAEKAENLSFCKGIKLSYIKEKVEELLSFIGKSGMFEEYTKHDISHVNEMLKIAEWLIPNDTKQKMTSAEWLMLTLAIYFHDLGMVVTKNEYENRYTCAFKEYKNNIEKNIKDIEYKKYAEKDDIFLYQEFVRENHAKRIKNWIEGKYNDELGASSTVFKELSEIIAHLDKMFCVDLAMLCESHHKDDIDNFDKYKIRRMYCNTEDERVNLNYIAIILRITDLLHITRDRTPSIARKLINVSDPTSIIEWEKQSAVRAVTPKTKRNEDGEVDEKRLKDTIEITAYFDGAETAQAFFGLSAYLQYTRKEIIKCFTIIEKAQKKEGASDYLFPWKEIDESEIQVIGFETKKLSFTIAQENILKLLVGHTLYNDSSVVVRELVQNAIDAVRLQKQYDIQDNKKITDGKVQVNWNENERELIFWDNGTGMTLNDIENYLLKVGASKYKDEAIKKRFPNFSSISHFGIGILTCFMIADNIDIITNSVEQKEASCINLRRVNGSYLLKQIEKKDLDNRIKKHGTMVKLYVRSEIDMSNVENDLKKWIIVPEIPVFFTYNENKEQRIGYDSVSDILKQYLEENGNTVDGERYDVYEEENGNVTVAYAVRHLKYMSEWCLMRIDYKNIRNKQTLPIGTCVEGIRVEFATPGYKETSILAIANIKNSKYQTNVARSAIELGSNNSIIFDIYEVYRKYIQSQMNALEKQGYSKSWALSEERYLMQPLIYDTYFNNKIEPMDEKLLIKSLAKLNCLAVENEKKREILSAEQVLNFKEINIFQCEMMRAGEQLLREIKNGATLYNILKSVYSEDNFLENVNNVICNYEEENILHKYAIKNKEVSSINVLHKSRRIRLTYSCKDNRWYHFKLRLRGYAKTLHIPKENFTINGLQGEIGVRTYGGIYIDSNTEFYNYIIKVINIFDCNENDENEVLLEIFMSYVFDSRILEQVYKNNVNKNSMLMELLEDQYIQANDELIQKMWNKIDTVEFSEVVLKQNYSLFSTDNWIRK